jgi:hypothetical protein
MTFKGDCGNRLNWVMNPNSDVRHCPVSIGQTISHCTIEEAYSQSIR